MILLDRQVKLLDFVKEAHKDQLRKYTEEPYATHLQSVADKVAPYVNKYPLIWEIAICHDLYEDTEIKYRDLYPNLVEFGYLDSETTTICHGVNDLTDHYTSERYPKWNRSRRKEFETIRLSEIPPRSQTVKYADLIDNTSSIVDYDPKFAVTYLQEKEMYLKVMIKGEWDLFMQAVYVLFNSKIKLELTPATEVDKKYTEEDMKQFGLMIGSNEKYKDMLIDDIFKDFKR